MILNKEMLNLFKQKKSYANRYQVFLTQICLAVQGLEMLVDRLVVDREGVVGELMHCLVGQCLGYFRSSSPALR